MIKLAAKLAARKREIESSESQGGTKRGRMANGSTDAVCGPLEPERVVLGQQHQQSGARSSASVTRSVTFHEAPRDSIIVTPRAMRPAFQSVVTKPAPQLPTMEQNQPQRSIHPTGSSSSSAPHPQSEQPNVFLQPLQPILRVVQIQIPPEQLIQRNQPDQNLVGRYFPNQPDQNWGRRYFPNQPDQSLGFPTLRPQRVRRNTHDDGSVTSPFSLQDVWKCPNHIWRKMKVLRDQYQEDLQRVYSYLSKKKEMPRPPAEYQSLKHYKELIREQLYYLNSPRGSLPRGTDDQTLKILERQMFYAIDTCPLPNFGGQPLRNRSVRGPRPF